MVLVAFFVCGIDAGFADTYNCQVQEISNFSFKRSNEFLFPTYGDWNDANGRALVCGHRGTDGCNSGVMAFINGEHYWRNNRYDGMNVYLCSTGGANAWAQHDKDYIQLCADTDGKTKVGTDGRYDYYCTNVVNTYVNNWYCVGQNRTDICRTEIEASPAPAPSPSPAPAPEPDPTTTPAPTITCVDRCHGMTGQQYAECTTCCKVPESYADWNGSECICADKTLDFNVLTQQCEAPKVTVEPQPVAEDPVECPTVQITLLNQWLVQYAGNVEITNRIMVILNYCNSGAVDLTVFNSMFLELQNFIKDQSTLSELSSQQAASRRRIANAVSDIRSVVDNLDISKWRTAEGNFNTSRLLSDSIAGVVLGTAGGLITSNVMKKNQASNGLEDIQCTVGGQVVAGWGDQFQVGIH